MNLPPIEEWLEPPQPTVPCCVPRKNHIFVLEFFAYVLVDLPALVCNIYLPWRGESALTSAWYVSSPVDLPFDSVFLHARSVLVGEGSVPLLRSGVGLPFTFRRSVFRPYVVTQEMMSTILSFLSCVVFLIYPQFPPCFTTLSTQDVEYRSTQVFFRPPARPSRFLPCDHAHDCEAFFTP